MQVFRRITRPSTWLGALLLGLLLFPATAAHADATDDYNVLLNFYRLQRWEQAAGAAESFLSTYPGEERVPLVKLYLGQSLIQQGQFEAARRVFRDFIEKHPAHQDLALARYRVGECSYFLRDWETAERELALFVDRHGENDLAEWGLEYLGESQLRQGKGDAAATTFESFLNRYQESRLRHEAEYGLAQARELQGQKEAALSLLRRIAEDRTHGRAGDAWFRIGRMHFEAGNHAGAAAAFAEVHAQFPQHRLALLAELNAGSARYHLEDYTGALRHFSTAARDPAHAAEAGFWKGLCEKGLESYEAAISSLLSAADASQDPELREKALFHAADCEYRIGLYDSALGRFLEVSSLQPAGEYADDGLYSAIETSLKLNDHDQALALHDRFRDEFGQSGLRMLEQVLHARVLISRGDARQAALPGEAAADFAQARDVLQSVIDATEVPRTASLARIQLARCHERLGEPERVVDALAPVIEDLLGATPEMEFVDALLVQSKVLLDLTQYEDVLRMVNRYLELAGSQPGEALAYEALAHAGLEDRNSARTALDRLGSTDQNQRLLRSTAFAIGEMAYERSDWEWALECYDRALGSEPHTTESLNALAGKAYSAFEWGRELAAAGQPNPAIARFHQAAESFQSLVELGTSDPLLQSAASHMHGLSLAEMGDWTASAVAYREGYDRFHEPVDLPEEVAREVAYNAYRCAKGGARSYTALHNREAADGMYARAHQLLSGFPADLQGDLPYLIHEWALLHYSAEDYERSDELFAQLVSDCPESDLADDAGLYLAESLFFGGDLPGARTALASLAKSPGADDFVRHRSLELLLDVAARLQDWDLAATTSADLLRLFPESPAVSYADYRLAEAQLQRGELETAARLFRELIDRRSEAALADSDWFPSVWLLLAETRFRQRNYEQVASVLDEFTRLYPESPFAYQADEIRGRALLRQARFDDARTAFQRVIDSEWGRRTETAAKAQFYIAESHLIQKDFESALRNYYSVYVNYDFPEWQSHALFQSAECDASLERWSDAAVSYQKLLDEFPMSEHAAAARERLQVARMRAGM